MKFAVLVQSNHNWQESQKHARTLCDHLQQMGHEIVAVLFNGDSSWIADKNSQHNWHDWSQSHDSACPLLICSSLSSQMNILPSSPAVFTVTGMATWTNLLEQADQLVELP